MILPQLFSRHSHVYLTACTLWLSCTLLHSSSNEMHSCVSARGTQLWNLHCALCRWGQQAKPMKQSPAPRPASPSSSLSSRSTRRSYSSDSSSRSRSSCSTSSPRSRSRSFSRSPSSLYRGVKGGNARKRTNPMKGSPEGAQGRAKKMKQAGPPETKKQRCVLPHCFISPGGDASCACLKA